MPASDYFTATNYTDYNEQPEYISFRLLGTGNISFKENTLSIGYPRIFIKFIHDSIKKLKYLKKPKTLILVIILSHKYIFLLDFLFE